jgi:hypothetical protein
MFPDLRNNLKSNGSPLYKCSISYSTLKRSFAPRSLTDTRAHFLDTANKTLQGAFGFYAAMNVLALCMIFLLVPETKQVFLSKKRGEFLNNFNLAYARRAGLYLCGPNSSAYSLSNDKSSSVVDQALRLDEKRTWT